MQVLKVFFLVSTLDTNMLLKVLHLHLHTGHPCSLCGRGVVRGHALGLGALNDGARTSKPAS